MRFAVSWTAVPQIVAEALIAVPDPLLTALNPGPPASGAAVVSSLACSLAPAEASLAPPCWLYPEQVRSYRRILASLERHAGAILADPVGSGKTYVALAVARAINRGPTVCLVPATLQDQWQQTAARLGIPVTVWSHELASRGRLPRSTRSLVIIDESHRFRNSGTRRYAHVASWLVGRPALLVTATPVVNRLADLANQLLLSARDDALVLDGIASIRQLLASGAANGALGQLVIEAEASQGRRPGRIHRISNPTGAEWDWSARVVAMLRRLQLSRLKPIAALVSHVLLRAASSSPAALEASLRRYRRLLLHARDAFATGRAIDRSELRRFTGDGDQLIWWELMPGGTPDIEMALGDLTELDTMIHDLAGTTQSKDSKLSRLRDLLNDAVPTLIFTASRDTVRYLRDRLADLHPAWCTGERAGVGVTAIPRRDVLSWFREDGSSTLAPRHLIVTDVAAEGLDLQRAARVVHYDLPWTPMRMEQREGRSVRYGSTHAHIEVIQFALPSPFERWLRLETTLLNKRRLPASAGLGPEGRHLWRWRSELAERFSTAYPISGSARLVGAREGLLAGYALHDAGSGRRLSDSVIWMESNGCWTEAPDTIAARLADAAGAREVIPIDGEDLRRWLTLLAVPIRDRLGLRQARRWVSADPEPVARNLASRLQSLIHQAARLHHPAKLIQLEHALGSVVGGHTAGEEMLLGRVASLPDKDLVRALRRLPAERARPEGVEVRLTGLIVFG